MTRLNKIFLSMLFVAMVFVIGNMDVIAQRCPQNFTPKTIYMDVGGCTYEIDICVYCSPLGAGATEVNITGGIILIPTTPPCQPSVPYSDVVDYVLSQINTPTFIYNELCSYTPDAPPCNSPQDPLVLKVNSPQCWKVEVIEYFGENTLFFSTCSDDVCQQTFEVCIDSNGEYQKTLINQIGGTPSCTVEATDEEFRFPDPNIDPVGTMTPCYIYHSPCNP